MASISIISYYAHFLILAIILCATVSVGLSTSPLSLPIAAKNSCRNPAVRKEWRTLNRKIQMEYLQAVRCLINKPSTTPLSIVPGVRNRLDDFVAMHSLRSETVHWVGHFLPWHRYFVAVYESTLRTECGYSGAQPYWDWNLDVPPLGKFLESPLWDDTYGFGGNGPYLPLPPDTYPPEEVVLGRTGGGCVPSGPFKNLTVHLGPNESIAYNPRCLARDFSPYIAGRYTGVNQTHKTLQPSDFGRFARLLEGNIGLEDNGLHVGGHFAVGGNLGQMADVYISPSDPLFYLHHANLDRMWWSWQKKDLRKRLSDISGPINYKDFDNLIGGNVTLDFSMSIGVNTRDVTIREVMDIRGGSLCYEYDRVY